LLENADWHLFIFTKIRISRKAALCAQSAEKRRKTKKTRENLGLFGWHLFCQDALARVDKKDAALFFPF